MADLPSHPDHDTGDDGGVRPGFRSVTGRPGWKPVVGIAVGILLVAVFVVLHLTGVLGPGEH